jgi:hypothetical protein
VSSISASVGSSAFWFATATVGLAGIVRGFAGFGSAMIMIPGLSAIYAPTVAIPVGLMLEVIVTVPFVRTTACLVDWRRLSLLTVTATAAVPLGAVVLATFPVSTLRWCMSLVVLVFVIVLAFGWRYPGRPAPRATVAAGTLSGLLNGSVGMAGPPIVFFLLAGPDKANRVRATCIVYFGLIDAITVSVLAVQGVVTAGVLVVAALLVPSYLIAACIGARFHRDCEEARYRHVALGILSLVAVGSLVA